MPSNITRDKSELKSEIDNPKQLLQSYCDQKSFDPPKYECRRSRFRKYIGTVIVEGVKYSTEPMEYHDEMRAENAAATEAMKNLKEFRISCDTLDGIAQKIYNCIGDNGVIHRYLPSIFE